MKIEFEYQIEITPLSHLAVGLVLFLDFNGTLFDIFVQADAGRDTRVGADDIRGRYCGAAQQIGRDARLQRRVGSYLNWIGQSEHYFSIIIQSYRDTYDFLHWDYCSSRWACCCCVRGNWTSNRVYRRKAAHNLDTISSNWSLRFTGTKVNQSMRVRKLMICFYKETENRRTKAQDSITKGVSFCLAALATLSWRAKCKSRALLLTMIDKLQRILLFSVKASESKSGRVICASTSSFFSSFSPASNVICYFFQLGDCSKMTQIPKTSAYPGDFNESIRRKVWVWVWTLFYYLWVCRASALVLKCRHN